MKFAFNTGVSPDPRRYNTPRAADVAVLYEGDAPPTNRVINVYPRTLAGGSQLHRPSDLSDDLDPMTYPLLFQDGQPGWHPHLRYDLSPVASENARRQKVTMAEFYTYRLMTRDPPSAAAPERYDPRRRIVVPWQPSCDDSAPAAAQACKSVLPHAGGRLFQQWCVDVFTRIEGERLEWCRRNQPLLRCETLQGLADYFEGEGMSKSAPGAGPHQPCPEASSVAEVHPDDAPIPVGPAAVHCVATHMWRR